MPTIKVVDLINKVATTLQDPTFVRWSQSELLGYLNEAQAEIANARPDAHVTTATFNCVNSAKQTLPVAAIRLVGVMRNVGGRAITKIKRSILDVQLPSWFEVSASSDGVKHYTYDQMNPKVFYLYPKPAADHQIEIAYSKTPETITVSNFSTDTQHIGLDDAFANAIMAYMLFRAYSKDNEYGNVQRAGVFLQAFGQSVGNKRQADGVISENMRQNDPGAQAQ